jgi:hypothetical protein
VRRGAVVVRHILLPLDGHTSNSLFLRAPSNSQGQEI